MKKVILDTSFIISAIRNKIDFLEHIKFLGLTPIVPIQVINELDSIVKSKKKLKFKDSAKLAIKLLQKKRIKKVNLKNKYVDKGLIDFSKQNKGVIIATLDKELKSKIPNQKLIIRAKKRLEVI